jgi:hypothetical protein
MESLERLQVFTAVTMKNAVFWDVAPCTSCVNRVPPKRRLTQELHGVTSEETALFIKLLAYLDKIINMFLTIGKKENRSRNAKGRKITGYMTNTDTVQFPGN